MPQAPRRDRRPRGRPARLREPHVRRGRARRRGVLTATVRRILGIDPGSIRTGWGLIEGTSARPVLVDCGTLRIPERLPFPERLRRLQTDLESLLSRTGPDVAAVESPFHGVSARSALQLAHARGVILAALAGAGVPVVELSPAEVKKAVTGNGRAEKDQVRRMVAALLGDPAAAAGPDLADALAAAICGLATGSFHDAVRRAEAPARNRRG